ncbi:hypothetical protein BDN71DRAFT_1572832 [Pleurotus eryngii]|uniref:Uncharacterized protein n=1 Tax=Pleurotus eryngii TaxID=5323 RepID=A0A9P6D6D5_PLEER|nr:hypothetical protein BDN71DRAFT_1572832 [Pleurotus eryngii]
MSSNLPFLGSVALQKAKVQPGLLHVSVTRIKYSSPAHGLIAVADLDRTLMESEIYVGFSNSNVIGYVIDKDMRDHTKDPHHRLSFNNPIYNIAFSLSGSQFAIAYREQVKIVKRWSFVPTLPTISVLELYGPSLPQPQTPLAMSPTQDLIIIVHMHSGAESYSIPDCTLLLKQDIYKHSIIRKDHIYRVDMVFVNSDTVAIGGAELILMFSNVRTGSKHDSISAPVLRDASSCSLQRLDVTCRPSDQTFRLITTDSNARNINCHILQFLESSPSAQDTQKGRIFGLGCSKICIGIFMVMLEVALRKSAILPAVVRFWPDNIVVDLPFSLPPKFQAVPDPVVVSVPVVMPVAVSDPVVASEPAALASCPVSSTLCIDPTDHEDMSSHQSASQSHVLLAPTTNSAPLSSPSLHLSESKVTSPELTCTELESSANIEANCDDSPPSDPIGKGTPTLVVTTTLLEATPPSTVTVIQMTERIITIREPSISIVVHYLITFTVVSLALTVFYRLEQIRAWFINLSSKGPKEAPVTVDKQDQEQLEGN